MQHLDKCIAFNRALYEGSDVVHSLLLSGAHSNFDLSVELAQIFLFLDVFKHSIYRKLWTFKDFFFFFSGHPAGDSDGDFHLHTSTGALSTSRGLDRETRADYTLEVVATDRGSPALSATVTVEVKVMDVNDNSPVFSKNSYSTEVSEDAAEGTKVLEVSRNLTN